MCKLNIIVEHILYSLLYMVDKKLTTEYVGISFFLLEISIKLILQFKNISMMK